MDGYRFISFEAAASVQKRAQACRIGKVAEKVLAEDGVRGSEAYEDAMEWFRTTIEGLEKRLAAEWARYFMVNAIAYGIQTGEKDWIPKFLAAYDLYKGL